jgi:hypothetical protein
MSPKHRLRHRHRHRHRHRRREGAGTGTDTGTRTASGRGGGRIRDVFGTRGQPAKLDVAGAAHHHQAGHPLRQLTLAPHHIALTHAHPNVKPHKSLADPSVHTRCRGPCLEVKIDAVLFRRLPFEQALVCASVIVLAPAHAHPTHAHPAHAHPTHTPPRLSCRQTRVRGGATHMPPRRKDQAVRLVPWLQGQVLSPRPPTPRCLSAVLRVRGHPPPDASRTAGPWPRARRRED